MNTTAKSIYLAIGALVVFFSTTFIIPMQRLHAADVIQMNDNQDIIMSGTVTDLDNHSFTLTSGDTKTLVSTDNLNGASDLSALLKDGMKITVRGSLATGMFNEPMIRATNISAWNDTAPTAAAVQPAAGATAIPPAAPEVPVTVRH